MTPATMTAPAVDPKIPTVGILPSNAPAVDTAGELAAARAESVRADAVLAAAKQRVVDAQAAAVRAQTEQGELVLAGAPIGDAAGVLAVTVAVVDAARSHVAAAERAAAAARAKENACFAAHLRRQAGELDAADERQRAEVLQLAKQHMARDGRLSWQSYWVDSGPQAGLIEQATRAQSTAFQLAAKK